MYALDLNTKIGVIGICYINLALERLFTAKFAVIGFDINQPRINGLWCIKKEY